MRGSVGDAKGGTIFHHSIIPIARPGGSRQVGAEPLSEQA